MKGLWGKTEAIKEGCNYDLEAGNGQRLNRNEHSSSNKLSIVLVKATLTFMITAVAIGYFIAISRDANIFGTLQGVDIANVTNAPVLGKHFWPHYIFMQRTSILLLVLLEFMDTTRPPKTILPDPLDLPNWGPKWFANQ